MKEERKNDDYVIMAEYRLLNALIHSEIYAHDARVHEDMFPHEIAKSIHKAVVKMYDKSIKITEASLFQYANEIDYNVTNEVVNRVITIDDGVDNLDDILEIVFRAKQKRAFNDKMHELMRDASANGDIDSIELMSKLYDAEAILAQLDDKTLLQSLDDWMDSYIKDLEGRADKTSYPFGDMLLDEALTKGAYPGAITTVAGATGQGKSAYVLNLLSRMIDQSIPAIYLSLEMGSTDTADRLVSLRKGIPTRDLFDPGDHLDSIIRLVKEEREDLKDNHNFYFSDEPSLSLVELVGLIKDFKARTKSDYCVIAIDLLTQLKDFMESSPGMNLAQSMERAMNKLNIIAKKENVHFIAVVQFNRDADNLKVTEIKDIDMLRPSLNNIKNAQAIAERSRAVLGIFRPKYYADRYLPDDPEVEYMEDIMEVQVLKQSNGGTPRLLYDFDGEVFQVTPYEEKEETDEEKQAEIVLKGNF